MFVVIVLLLIILLYWWWSSGFGKWKKLNIPHVAPHFLWGNCTDVVYMRKTLNEVYESIYRNFPDQPYVGVYVVNRPGLLIRDPDLIKSVTQQNFSHFHNNELLIDEKVDPIFGKNPFSSRDELWKERRAIHTRQFSTGKLKYMYNMVIQGGDKLIEYLNNEINANGKFTVESKELASKYTLYNVGACALGIDPMTFEDDNAEMRVMSRDIKEPDFFIGFKQFLIFILPNLGNFLSVTIIPPKVTQRVERLIKEQLQYREKHKIVRNDFFESIQEYKGERVEIEEMIVQVGGFFVDGSFTSSAAFAFILYELAANLDVQRKLMEEIDTCLAKHKEELSYEVFQSLSYLNGVFLEGVRKYPPFGVLTKVCTQPFEFPPINNNTEPLPVQVGTPIVVPVMSLHHDEKYFSDPERFDPERHIGENKASIIKGSFIPFGEGPRSCIGERFALLQGKMLLFKLLSKFEIRLNAKTKVPLTFNPQSIILEAEGGIWIDIRKRDTNFPDQPYVGVYIVNRPGLLVRDPDLIKSVTQQNFSHFHNNDLLVDEKVDPIFGKNPFVSRDELWKQRRAIHTRQFSTGKLKYMYNMVIQGGDKLVQYLNSEINVNNKFTIESNELASKYTLYNVGACALGIDPMTFEDDNAEMRVIGRDIIEPNIFTAFKQFLIFILPKLGNFLSVTIIPPKVTQRLQRLIKEQLQYREKHKIVRNDFFESIQEYKGERADIEEMIVQVGGFLVDGFFTSSAAFGFILYELAANLDVQRKLMEEIDKCLAKHKGELSYEVFQSLSYINGVFLEGVRKYPPLGVLTRVCTQPFEFPPINNNTEPLPVQVGTPIVVPVIGLHHDEKYFPDPERFDPERHIGENKASIIKGSFMPFGEGPRSCIGERFALLQGKMLLFKLLSKFEIRLNAKTKVPLTFNPQSIILAAEGGIWIDICKRDK
ncbi:cytochrome p450 [Holotrichia oblita]|uniref:Cytochrome p450 n=1 Tax=Holotrichia oblita TaxID=644536 RepID=A0ACB9SSM6_HOLOL|nr:cytochrome p450 [Holotrichia oblita]